MKYVVYLDGKPVTWSSRRHTAERLAQREASNGKPGAIAEIMADDESGDPTPLCTVTGNGGIEHRTARRPSPAAPRPSRVPLLVVLFLAGLWAAATALGGIIAAQGFSPNSRAPLGVSLALFGVALAMVLGEVIAVAGRRTGWIAGLAGGAFYGAIIVTYGVALYPLRYGLSVAVVALLAVPLTVIAPGRARQTRMRFEERLPESRERANEPPLTPPDEDHESPKRSARSRLLLALTVWALTFPGIFTGIAIAAASGTPDITATQLLAESAIIAGALWLILLLLLIQWWREGRTRLWIAPLTWLATILIAPLWFALFSDEYRRAITPRRPTIQ
jgi:MFS family permease